MMYGKIPGLPPPRALTNIKRLADQSQLNAFENHSANTLSRARHLAAMFTQTPNFPGKLNRWCLQISRQISAIAPLQSGNGFREHIAIKR